MQIFIYGLYDPRNDELRYVGKSKNPKHRLFEHINTVKNGEISSKAKWLKELIDNGYIPLVKILEKTNADNWEEVEKRWIEKCRLEGLNLLNVAEGGSNPPDWLGRKQSIFHIRKRVEARQAKGNYHHSDETKRKLSEKKKGTQAGPNNPFYGKHHTEETKQKIKTNNSWYKHTDEIRKKISEGVRRNPPKIIRKPVSDETRKKLSKAHKGRKLSPEHVEKLRQANLGKPVSEETKEKLRQANLGKHHSEETKKKIGLLSKGQKMSESAKEKLRLANIGRKMTEEQRIKNSQNIKSLWQNPEYRAKMLAAQKRRREREALEKAGQC
jgi:group I intron endonuclease